MASSFVEKLATVQATTRSSIGLLLSPRLNRMPLPIRRYDEPFLPYGKAIINATRDLVCAYVFDLAAYLAIGAAGGVALERTIAYAGHDSITILHGPFVGAGYAQVLYETAFGVDAVTLADGQYLDIYLERPDRCAFVVRTGRVDTFDAPATGGYYWEEVGLFTLVGSNGQVVRIQLAGGSVLEAAQGDNFTEQIRAEMERQRWQ